MRFLKRSVSFVFAFILVGSVGLCAFAAEAVGFVNTSLLNFRAAPSTDSPVLMQMIEGSELRLISLDDGWYKARCEGIVGFVKSEYVTAEEPPAPDVAEADVIEGAKVLESPLVEEEPAGDSIGASDPIPLSGGTGENPAFPLRGVIIGSVVNLRSGPSTDLEILSQLRRGGDVTVSGVQGEWAQVEAGGRDGWVHRDYVLYTDLASAASPLAAGRSDVLALALKHLGVRYVRGGASPSGFDCSGFTSYIYKQMGYPINRTASTQLGNGTPVEKSQLVPGDLVFFKDPAYGKSYPATHVGIYIGGSQFIHATRPGDVVRISSFDESYYARWYTTARRIIP